MPSVPMVMPSENRDGVDLHRRAAGLADAAHDVLGEIAVGEVAGHGADPVVGDHDQGFGEGFVVVADGVELGARGGRGWGRRRGRWNRSLSLLLGWSCEVMGIPALEWDSESFADSVPAGLVRELREAVTCGALAGESRMSQRVDVGSKPPGFLLRVFPAMEYLEYRRMFYAAGLSAISLWAMITARGWLGYELTGNPSGTGIVTFAAIGPWVLAPIGGALADRFDRAKIVIVCRFGAALTAVALAILAFSGLIEMWNLVLITLVSGIIRSGEMPSQQALLPNTVKMHALLSAITMASMMQFGSKVIGPVAGPIIKAFGPEWVFAAAALLLLLSILQMTRMTTRSTGGIQGHTSGLMRDTAGHMREGLRYLGKARSVRLMIIMVSLHCMFTMAFDFSLLPAYADLILGGGQSEYGYMLMAIGGGALASTIVLSMLPMGRVRGRVFMVTGVFSGLSLVWVGFARIRC